MDLNGTLDDIEGGRYQFETNGKKPLRFTDKISDLWPQPPSDEPLQLQLHIYISLPRPAREYSHLVAPAQAI